MIDKKILDQFSGIQSVAHSAKAIHDQLLRSEVLEQFAMIGKALNSVKNYQDQIVNAFDRQQILDQYSGVVNAAHSAKAFHDQLFSSVDRQLLFEQFAMIGRALGTVKIHQDQPIGSKELQKISERFSLVSGNSDRSFDFAKSLVSDVAISDVMKQVEITPVFLDALQEINVSTSANFNIPPPKVSTNNNSKQNLLDYINGVPEKGRAAIIVLFLYYLIQFSTEVAWDISINLASSLIQPKINELLLSKPSTSTKEINKLSTQYRDNSLDHMRIVVGDRLNVRKSSNQNSEITDEITRFTVVTFLTKDSTLNWSLIRYKNDSDQIIEGWVFSRYLRKLQS